MHALLTGIILLLASAIMLAGYSVYLMWRDGFGSQARAYAKRREAIGKGKALSGLDLSILKPSVQDELAQVPKTGVFAGLAWLLRHAGLGWSPRRFGAYSAAGALASGVIGSVAGLPLGMDVALAGAGAYAPFALVRYRSNKRTEKMEQQLPDVLDMMAGMLRAGHTLPGTLSLLSEHIPAPIGEEFKLLHSEMTYGGSAEDAMNHLVARTRNETIRGFVMAVLVQRETGGNLTDVLLGLSEVVRERLKLRGKIRALSAEGRMSAWVLTALPLVVGGIIQVINPSYLDVFWVDPTGIKMMYGMLAMLLLGNLWMRKLIRIRA